MINRSLKLNISKPSLGINKSFIDPERYTATKTTKKRVNFKNQDQGIYFRSHLEETSKVSQYKINSYPNKDNNKVSQWHPLREDNPSQGIQVLPQTYSLSGSKLGLGFQSSVYPINSRDSSFDTLVAKCFHNNQTACRQWRLLDQLRGHNGIPQVKGVYKIPVTDKQCAIRLDRAQSANKTAKAINQQTGSTRLITHDDDDKYCIVMEKIQGGDLVQYARKQSWRQMHPLASRKNSSNKSTSSSSASENEVELKIQTVVLEPHSIKSQGHLAYKNMRKTSKVSKKTLSIMYRLLQTLEILHQKGIKHRDIKPLNIMLRRDGSPVLIDFGFGEVSAESDQKQIASRKTKNRCGTPGYLSPQFGTNALSDIYSLGAVFYLLVTGQQLFDGQNIQEILAANLSFQTTNVSERLQGFIKELLEAMLQIDPTKRISPTEALKMSLFEDIAKQFNVLQGTPTQNSYIPERQIQTQSRNQQQIALKPKTESRSHQVLSTASSQNERDSTTNPRRGVVRKSRKYVTSIAFQ